MPTSMNNIAPQGGSKTADLASPTDQTQGALAANNQTDRVRVGLEPGCANFKPPTGAPLCGPGSSFDDCSCSCGCLRGSKPRKHR
jgi:hypothetical protein